MKILNLYAGIGGNRKLWGDEHEITAVELDPNIAKIYQDLYPDDNVIIDDAHEYLRKHFREFDFIFTAQFQNNYTSIRDDIRAMQKAYGFDLSKYARTVEIRKVLRNCVVPEIGKYIFDELTRSL